MCLLFECLKFVVYVCFFKFSQEVLVESPKLWIAETPYLYKVVFQLWDYEANLVKAVPWKFGFR
ncbi:MAG: hypothetical protein ACLFM7_13895 [Bacteroidales bacterium]